MCKKTCLKWRRSHYTSKEVGQATCGDISTYPWGFCQPKLMNKLPWTKMRMSSTNATTNIEPTILNHSFIMCKVGFMFVGNCEDTSSDTKTCGVPSQVVNSPSQCWSTTKIVVYWKFFMIVVAIPFSLLHVWPNKICFWIEPPFSKRRYHFSTNDSSLFVNSIIYFPLVIPSFLVNPNI